MIKPYIFKRNGVWCVTAYKGRCAIPLAKAMNLAADFVRRLNA
jgi:hypothetical protein